MVKAVKRNYSYKKRKNLIEKCSGGDKESKRLEKGSDDFDSIGWSWWYILRGKQWNRLHDGGSDNNDNGGEMDSRWW